MLEATPHDGDDSDRASLISLVPIPFLDLFDFLLQSLSEPESLILDGEDKWQVANAQLKKKNARLQVPFLPCAPC